MTGKEGDWRRGLRSVAKEQLYMLENGTLSDCTFTLAPEGAEPREFRLHRLILCRASEVFEAMLAPPGGRMLEAQTGQVTITDTQPDIFHTALKCIYSGKGSHLAALPLEEVLGVSGVADKYLVWSLQATCERRLCELLDPDCVWRLLGVCETLQDYQGLREKCVELLQGETLACLRSPGLAGASEDSVTLLLEQDELAVDSELPLVLAATRWARLESDRQDSESSERAVLEPRLLPLLRLLSLSEEQLHVACGLGEDWLSDQERAALTDEDLDALPDCFSRRTDKRENNVEGSPSENLFIVDRLASVSKYDFIRKSLIVYNRVVVKVSSAVWLKGIFFSRVYYNYIQLPGPFDDFDECVFTDTHIDISISTCTTGEEDNRIAPTDLVHYELSDGVCSDKFILPEPYRLEPGETYCIEITPYAPPTRDQDNIIFFSRTPQLKNSAVLKLDNGNIKFTFNLEESELGSAISGEDIVHGLLCAE